MLCIPATRDQILQFLPKGGVVAEIGVAEGEFSRLILETAAPRRLHLIDPWHHQDLADYANDPNNVSDEGHEKRFLKVNRTFAREIEEGRVVVHRDYSARLAPCFDERSLDWIYVDGQHTYEAVTEDLTAYYPKVKDDGFIVGDDYTNHLAAQRMNFGVVEAVDDFVGRTGCAFVALGHAPYPTYVLAKTAEAESVKRLVASLVYNVPGTVEIRDYPARPYVHMTYEFGKDDIRLVPSF